MGSACSWVGSRFCRPSEAASGRRGALRRFRPPGRKHEQCPDPLIADARIQERARVTGRQHRALRAAGPVVAQHPRRAALCPIPRRRCDGIDVHVRAPRRPDRVHAAHAAHDVLPIERHVLAERRILARADRWRSAAFASPSPAAPPARVSAPARSTRETATSECAPAAARRSLPSRAADSPAPCRRLASAASGSPSADHRAHKEPPSRVPSRDRIHLPGVHVMRNPLLLAHVGLQ